MHRFAKRFAFVDITIKLGSFVNIWWVIMRHSPFHFFFGFALLIIFKNRLDLVTHNVRSVIASLPFSRRGGLFVPLRLEKFVLFYAHCKNIRDSISTNNI